MNLNTKIQGNHYRARGNVAPIRCDEFPCICVAGCLRTCTRAAQLELGSDRPVSAQVGGKDAPATHSARRCRGINAKTLCATTGYPCIRPVEPVGPRALTRHLQPTTRGIQRLDPVSQVSAILWMAGCALPDEAFSTPLHPRETLATAVNLPARSSRRKGACRVHHTPTSLCAHRVSSKATEPVTSTQEVRPKNQGNRRRPEPDDGIKPYLRFPSLALTVDNAVDPQCYPR